VELAGRAAHAAARLDATTARLAELEREAAAATSALEQAHGAHAALPDIAALAEAGEGARLAVEETREAERTAASAAEQAARRLEQMAARRAAIARELADCAGRADRAVARCADLAGRLESLAREADDVRGQIAAFAERQAERRDLVAAAEAACRAVAAEVATAAAEADAAEVAARDTEAAASAGRERLARAESEADRAEAAYAEISERVIEQFGALDALPVAAPGMRAESVTTLRGKITRLLAEREAIGPVNLRADLDLERLVEQAGVNAREAEELGEAIAKLRGSIGQLNGEGRERIGAALERINRHFGRLFARMFGGGQAHLSFVGSDDWLEAGLEIFAQPPGKKLATLSLLSGGEQTLTALALLFAVFLCNPAPVCVLDEVDAPLDEANVGRFCDLLADLGATTGTRFLVVTHHPLTMARMDRLYGVTMQERGVSRLVSVDLTAAVRLSEPMHLAAD